MIGGAEPKSFIMKTKEWNKINFENQRDGSRLI